MKTDVYTRNVDAQDELLARISDAAASLNKGEDQLRRYKRDCARALQSELKLLKPATLIPPQPNHTETSTHIETRTIRPMW